MGRYYLIADVRDCLSFWLFGYLEVVEKDSCNIFVTKITNGVDKQKDRLRVSSREVQYVRYA